MPRNPDVRPSNGSILVPLFEKDGLRMGELAARARLSKQTMTTIVRLLERDGLVERRADPSDGRTSLGFLSARARGFRPVAEGTLVELGRLVVRTLSARGRTELREALRSLAELCAPPLGGSRRPSRDEATSLCSRRELRCRPDVGARVDVGTRVTRRTDSQLAANTLWVMNRLGAAPCQHMDRGSG
jgi:DNA-binding MarR family transcriptional regulator